MHIILIQMQGTRSHRHEVRPGLGASMQYSLQMLPVYYSVPMPLLDPCGDASQAPCPQHPKKLTWWVQVTIQSRQYRRLVNDCISFLMGMMGMMEIPVKIRRRFLTPDWISCQPSQVGLKWNCSTRMRRLGNPGLQPVFANGLPELAQATGTDTILPKNATVDSAWVQCLRTTWRGAESEPHYGPSSLARSTSSCQSSSPSPTAKPS